MPGAEEHADIPGDKMNQILKTMLQSEIFDEVMVAEQSLGQISFYLTSWGEEALHVGSAAALEFEDIVFPQYRELGVLFYRGFSIEEAISGCYCNKNDNHKGR